MLGISSLSHSIIILLCAALVSKAELPVLDGIDFSNDMVAVDLSDSMHPIEILEYSDGLSEWVPVSRNYGKGWESVFPFGYSVVSETLSMPQSNQGFFRKSYQASVASYENKELASRFLRQATFGPRIEDINNFPNVDGANFSDSEYADFELWIDNQVAVAPFYHRAYW